MTGVHLLSWFVGGGAFVLVVVRDVSVWVNQWLDARPSPAGDSYDDEGFEGWGGDDWPEPGEPV